MLERARAELVTPAGVRTLSPSDTAYRGRFGSRRKFARLTGRSGKRPANGGARSHQALQAQLQGLEAAADGLKDPATGDYTGISAAYEIEGVPAFIPPEDRQALAKGGQFKAARK